MNHTLSNTTNREFTQEIISRVEFKYDTKGTYAKVISRSGKTSTYMLVHAPEWVRELFLMRQAAKL